MTFTLLLFALAQGTGPVLESLEIDVWPEYDRPAALVMYQFRVSPTTSLDAPVPIPIPASVGEPHAVAWRDVQGSLLLADYFRRVDGDRATILARLGSYEGQLEFYADIAFEGSERRFEFQWPGGVSIGSLSFDIQQPLGASDLSVVPEPDRRGTGSDGLDYAHLELGAVDENAQPTIEVRYVKTSDRLTDPNNPASSASASASARTDETTTSDSNAVLFAVGGILFGAGAAWLVWSYLGTKSASKRTVRESRLSPEDVDVQRVGEEDGEAAPFCHACGAKTRPEATFCMECGTKLLKKPG